MDDIAITFIATSNQIDMLRRSSQRFDNVTIYAYNLASQETSSIFSEIQRKGIGDILFITDPTISGFDTLGRYVSEIDHR